MFAKYMWCDRDRIRNEEIRRRIGVQVGLSGGAESCVLIWFGHVERMNMKEKQKNGKME